MSKLDNLISLLDKDEKCTTCGGFGYIENEQGENITCPLCGVTLADFTPKELVSKQELLKIPGDYQDNILSEGDLAQFVDDTFSKQKEPFKNCLLGINRSLVGGNAPSYSYFLTVPLSSDVYPIVYSFMQLALTRKLEVAPFLDTNDLNILDTYSVDNVGELHPYYNTSFPRLLHTDFSVVLLRCGKLTKLEVEVLRSYVEGRARHGKTTLVFSTHQASYFKNKDLFSLYSMLVDREIRGCKHRLTYLSIEDGSFLKSNYSFKSHTTKDASKKYEKKAPRVADDKLKDLGMLGNIDRKDIVID